MQSLSIVAFREFQFRLKKKYEATPATHETEKRRTEKTTESKCVDNLSVGVHYEKLTETTRETIEEVVSKKERSMYNGRYVSNETKNLFEERTRTFVKTKPCTKTRKIWNKKIRRACRNDYKEWVKKWTERMEEANRLGNAREVYRAMRAVSDMK